MVTAHKEGKANIEVYLENGLASTECQITVAKVAAARLTILVPDRIVKVGQNERFQFTAIVSLRLNGVVLLILMKMVYFNVAICLSIQS